MARVYATLTKGGYTPRLQHVNAPTIAPAIDDACQGLCGGGSALANLSGFTAFVDREVTGPPCIISPNIEACYGYGRMGVWNIDVCA